MSKTKVVRMWPAHPTRAEAAAVLRRMSDETVALIKMEEEDLRQADMKPTAEQQYEHDVRRAVAKFLTLKAAVWENTCKGGSCTWKPDDLVRGGL